MSEQLTLGEVLEKAIQKEVNARSLYADLRERVTKPAVREAFQALSNQEDKHRQTLEGLLNGNLEDSDLDHSLVVDYRIVECLEQPEMTPDMELKDVFLLAASREKASHELYVGLAQIQSQMKVKHLFEDLAHQELEHKQRVETLYTEVAFPQTDGG